MRSNSYTGHAVGEREKWFRLNGRGPAESNTGMPQVPGFCIASLLFCSFASFPAELLPEKRLFVTRVEALKPLKDEKQTVPDKAKAPKSQESSVTEFVLETSATAEASVEARAQQIGAMNGTPLIRSSPRPPTSRGSSASS